ncbi:MAG: lipocalin-like domain-containing protein, partial [Nitrospinaceae bacterium]
PDTPGLHPPGLDTLGMNAPAADAAGAPPLAVAPFRQALPGREFAFPRDFYAHEDFRIEWWYYTGNLQDGAGREFGYQLTFFRVALEPPAAADRTAPVNQSRWTIRQVYFAHLTVADMAGERFYFHERINRPALGLAGAATDALKVWNEDWSLTGTPREHRLQAREKGIGLDLTLVPVKPLVVHGQQGVSRKGPAAGQASHYFSFTRMRTTGTLSLRGKTFAVTGTSWMDHEFSSNQLHASQAGWDWFAIKLTGGTDLVVYQIRLREGGTDPHSNGTLVPGGGGTPLHLDRDQVRIRSTGDWTSPHSAITYPAGWVLEVPSRNIHLTVVPDLADQELHQLRSISGSYWEGSVTVEGTAGGRPVTGRGYVELVGYGKPLQQELPD